MWYWNHSQSSRASVVLANETSFLVGHCELDDVERVRHALDGLQKPVDVLGADNVTVVPYMQVREVLLIEGEPTVSVSFENNNAIETVKLFFSDFDYALDFINYQSPFLPTSLAQKNTQQSVLSAIGLPLIYFLLLALAALLLWDKYRVPVFTVGGVAALAISLWLFQRLRSREKWISWGLASVKAPSLASTTIKSRGFAFGIMGFLALAIVGMLTPDRYGEAALFDAVSSGSTSASDVSQAITRGADINYRDSNGVSALQLAIDFKEHSLAIALIQAGADAIGLMPDHATGKEVSSLEYGIKAAAPANVIYALLDRGALVAAERTGFYAAEYAKNNDDKLLLNLINAQFITK